MASPLGGTPPLYVYAARFGGGEVTTSHSGEQTQDITPAEARDLAARLLACADYAEGKQRAPS